MPSATHPAPGAAGSLMLAGLGLALFSTLAGLSPWPVGLWSDSEPIALAVHFGAALAALGLALESLRRPWLPQACLAHPFVLPSLLLAAWSVIAAAGAADPAAALLGSPQTAEGPLLILDGAMFTAAGLVLGRTPGGAAAIGWSALAAGVVLPALSLFAATRVYFFGAWMVFPAIAAPVVVVLFLKDHRPRRTLVLLAAIAGLPGCLLSGSVTAVFAGLLAVPAVWLGCRDRALSGRPHRHAVSLAALTAALPILLAAGVLGFTVIHGPARPETRALADIWSRGYLQLALITDLADHPWRWLTGAGWGQIADIFTRTVTAAGLPLWNGSWDLMDRDIVNSHHFALEALLAAGLPGFALRLAGLAVLPVFCRPELRTAAAFFALALGTMSSLWFQLPGTVAMVALATAAFGSLEPPPARRRGSLGIPVPVALLVAFAAGQGTVVATLASEGLAAGTLGSAYIAPESPPPLADCDAGRFSGWRARPYLANLLSHSLREFRTLEPSARLSEASLRAAANLVCLTGRPPFRESVTAQTFALALRGDLALVPANAPYLPYFDGYFEDWGRQVSNYLTLAPRRSDIAIPYLVWLDRHGRFADLFAAADRMLAIDADDPIALWYSGAALTRQPGQGRLGFARMRRALDTGIELRIEVAPAQRRQVLEESARG